MKKILQLVTCLLPVMGMAQEKKATINGTIDNIKETTSIYALYYNKITGGKTFDSTVVKDGKFSLSVTIPGYATSVMMFKSTGQDGMQQSDAGDTKAFLLDEGGTNIAIKDSMRTAVLTNNKMEEEKAAYVKYMYLPKADSLRMGHYINGVSAIVLSITATQPDSVKDKENYEKYQKTMASLQKMQDLVQDKLVLQRKFVKEHPNAYFSLSALEDIARYSKNIDEALPLFNGLAESLRNSGEGKAILASLEKTKNDRLHPEVAKAKSDAMMKRPVPLATGTIAPDFTQFDVNGKPVKLSDFKGQYVLIDFWASWCVPCRAENPNLLKAYNEFKDRNFTVLGVALEEKGSKEAWLKAIKKDGLTWTQVADIEKGENPVAKTYGVSGIPYNFLVDPSGKIIASNIRGEDLQNKLTEILAN